jgi:RNA polymerase sigma-70 factor (ECF subfamily)
MAKEQQNVSQVVERCWQKDREAFGQLYDAMHDRLRRVCSRYVDDESVVDDLMHDAFLLIFSKIHTLKDAGSAEAWMVAVARNLSLVYAEHRRNNPVSSFDELSQPLSVAASPSLPITYDEILHLVEALPEGCQRVFRLSVFEGLSHQEIAALLNIEPHTSSSQLFRAKKLLRQSLAVLLFALLAVVLPLGIYEKLRETPPPANEGKTPPPASPFEGRGVAAHKGKTAEETVKPSPLSSQRTLANLGESVAKDSTQEECSIVNQSSVSDVSQSSVSDISQPSVADVSQPSASTVSQSSVATVSQSSVSDISVPAVTTADRWQLTLAYSGVPTSGRMSLPYANTVDDMNNIDSTAHHKMPLTVALDVAYRLSNRLSLTAGVQYTWLSSEFKAGNTFTFVEHDQTVRYLGFRIGADYQLASGRHWGLYGLASAYCDLPLRSVMHTSYIHDGRQVLEEDTRLSPRVQWSVGAGVGAQYDLTPTVGFFVEPTLRYYFRNGSGIETWRTEHPASLSLPLGVRITF